MIPINTKEMRRMLRSPSRKEPAKNTFLYQKKMENMRGILSSKNDQSFEEVLY